MRGREEDETRGWEKREGKMMRGGRHWEGGREDHTIQAEDKIE